MRKLTLMQKKLLKLAFNDYKRKTGHLPYSTDDLDYSTVVLLIDNINPCEVFWQNANRFLDDIRSEELRA